jgi:formate/nitrite transporter FocA (FNT family)
MYVLSFGILTKLGAESDFWGLIGRAPSAYPHLTLLASVKNLLWVTVGNMVGGMLVGIAYWFIYLRNPNIDKGAAKRNV